MRIYLIRHAKQESIFCNDNTPLDAIGRKQAELLGKRLLSYGIDLLYSSDLLRAEETGKIIKEQIEYATKKEIKQEVREGLREADFGTLTGLRDEVIADEFKEFMESRYSVEEDWTYPEGESGSEVYVRAKKVIDEILLSGGKNIAVVTHGGTIRCLLAGLFQGGQAKRLLFGKCFERGGITELYYDEKKKRFFLERFNDFAHLEGNKELMMRKEEKNKERYPIILASGSPRRKEILEQVGVSFSILTSEKEEIASDSKPEGVVKELSLMKAKDVAEQIDGDAIIIGADTVVSHQDNILGKPKSEQEAYEMIAQLQADDHFVYTGVAVIIKEGGEIKKEINFSQETKVSVLKMSEEQIWDYVKTGEPMDKAGAYGIQGKFAIYIKGINGDYYNVVGLPIAKLHEVLLRENINILSI